MMNKYAAQITSHPFAALLVAGLVLASVAADAPIASYAMAYAAVGEETLYIQGGTTDGGQSGINQFFSLDLTQKTWDTSSPPWKSLSVGMGVLSSPNAWEHSMTLSKDRKNLLVYDSTPSAPGISVFDLLNSTWLAKRALPSNPLTSNYYGLRSAVDPNTGIIYIPTGTRDNQTLAYDPESGIGSLLPNPEASVMNSIITLYSVVWSVARNSLLLYGGRGITPNGIVPNPYFAELVPGPTSTWRTLATTGQFPGAVERHCMVSAYGGTKMILFGGCTISRLSLGSIYILDMKTLSWTKGPDVEPSQNRSGMACAVAGDNFVVWGGEHFETSIVNLASTLVFNLRTNQWTTQFSLLETPLSGGTGGDPNASSDPPSSRPKASDKVNWAGIGGGIACFMVVVVIIVIFTIRRRKNARTDSCNNTQSMSSASRPRHESPGSQGYGAMIGALEQNHIHKEEKAIPNHRTVLEAPESTSEYSGAHNTDFTPSVADGGNSNMHTHSRENRRARAPHAHMPQEPMARSPQRVLNNPQYTS